MPEQGHRGRAAQAMVCSVVEATAQGVTKGSTTETAAGAAEMSHALLPPIPLPGSCDGTIVTAEKIKKLKLGRRKDGVSY